MFMYGVNDEEVDGDEGYHQGGPDSFNGIGTTSPQLENEVCMPVFLSKMKQRRNCLRMIPDDNNDTVYCSSTRFRFLNNQRTGGLAVASNNLE